MRHKAQVSAAHRARIPGVAGRLGLRAKTFFCLLGVFLCFGGVFLCSRKFRVGFVSAQKKYHQKKSAVFDINNASRCANSRAPPAAGMVVCGTKRGRSQQMQQEALQNTARRRFVVNTTTVCRGCFVGHARTTTGHRRRPWVLSRVMASCGPEGRRRSPKARGGSPRVTQEAFQNAARPRFAVRTTAVCHGRFEGNSGTTAKRCTSYSPGASSHHHPS